MYADTSALAKLLLDEAGSAEMAELAEAADVTVTVAIGYVELRAALGAAKRAGRLNDARRASLAVSLERIWSDLDVVPVDAALLRHAADLSDEAGLRGYDAVHLAALMATGDPDELLFACWDRGLRMAAQGRGFELRPTDLD